MRSKVGELAFRVDDDGGKIIERFFDDPAQQAIFDALDYTREQNLINASLGIRTQKGFAVSLWARNLFNDEYLVFASPTVLQAGSFSGAPGQPRTFGLTVRRSF